MYTYITKPSSLEERIERNKLLSLYNLSPLAPQKNKNLLIKKEM
jgi:hypothetical protein